MKTSEMNLSNENEQLKQEVAELRAKLSWYEEQHRLGQLKKYGAKSEASSHQLSFFDEAEGSASAHEKEPTIEEIKYTRKKRVGKRDEDLADLPVEELHYELNQKERSCPDCAHELHDMGSDVRREIKIIPAKAIVVEHIRHKYACRQCQTKGMTTPIIKADAPTPPIPGSLASPSSIAFIMSQKYAEGLPLYRQEKYLNGLGVNLSRQTMANWMILSTERHLVKIYEHLKVQLLSQDIICADETPVQVLKEDDRKATTKSTMWLYRSGKTDKPIVLFDYRTTRASKHPKAFLNGFSGFLQTDGYVGYRAIPNVTLMGCFAHARRYFHDAVKAGSPKNAGAAQIGLDYCNQLFAIERTLSDEQYSSEKRKLYRQEHSQVTLNAFLVWLKTTKPEITPKSLTAKAITYCLNQWRYLTAFLHDGRIDISNNQAERSIKPFVIGRKNWLFSDTQKAATASSIIYSLIETAKENGLIPFQYLKFLLEHIPNLKPDDNLDHLMPWHNSIPDDCFPPTKR